MTKDIPNPWTIPALVSGPWHDLDDGTAEELRHLLQGGESRDRSLAEAGKLLRFRVRPLPFWQDFLWIDALIDMPFERAAVGSFVYGPLGPLPIDGELVLVHELNSRALLDLGTAEKASDYLRVFCSVVRGDEGPFFLIEFPQRFRDLSAMPDMPGECSAAAVPIEIARDGSGWTATTLVYYGGAMFRSSFSITEDGLVEMVDDELLSQPVPYPVIATDGFICRILTGGDVG